MIPRAALIFPGQGSQKPGMLDAIPELDSFDRLLDAAEALAGTDIRAVAMLGSAADLADTRVAQPLLFLADWAWGVALRESGVEPFAVAGHSLGEYAALVHAGVFSVEAGLELVVERSRLMATAAAQTPGGMAAVFGLDAARIAAIIEDVEGVWVANDNAPGQVVISGASEALERASDRIEKAGAKRLVALKVAGPFHSPLMEPVQQAFAEILASAEFSDAEIPILQNTDPTPETSAEAIRERLATQIASPVRWTETMQALAADGPVTLVETGPGSVLSGLARGVDGIAAISVESAGLERVVEEVS